MKKIGIHGRAINPASLESVHNLLEILEDRGAEVCLTSTFLRDNSDISGLRKFPNFNSDQFPELDAVFSLGGDGTMLDTLTIVGKRETPILGINMGRLGFLATIAKDQLPKAIDHFFEGNYTFDRRTLVRLETEIDLFQGIDYALNEFAILRRETSSMIIVEAYLNDEYLNTYWADGLMVATPTGSTGYSLSCGGPILAPQTHNFVITPVSPHNLNVRPLIVPDTSELTFKVESTDTNYLISLDSRSRPVSGQMLLRIKKADFSANLIKIEGYNFIETLKNKLSWGLDKRN